MRLCRSGQWVRSVGVHKNDAETGDSAGHESFGQRWKGSSGSTTGRGRGQPGMRPHSAAGYSMMAGDHRTACRRPGLRRGAATFFALITVSCPCHFCLLLTRGACFAQQGVTRNPVHKRPQHFRGNHPTRAPVGAALGSGFRCGDRHWAWVPAVVKAVAEVRGDDGPDAQGVRPASLGKGPAEAEGRSVRASPAGICGVECSRRPDRYRRGRRPRGNQWRASGRICHSARARPCRRR